MQALYGVTCSLVMVDEYGLLRMLCTLMVQEVYKLDAGRLYATYFGGDDKQGLKPDDEAKQIW